MQFTQAIVWRCEKCGRLLKTDKGVERHKQKCSYTPPIIEGQIGFAGCERPSGIDIEEYSGANTM